MWAAGPEWQQRDERSRAAAVEVELAAAVGVGSGAAPFLLVGGALRWLILGRPQRPALLWRRSLLHLIPRMVLERRRARPGAQVLLGRGVVVMRLVVGAPVVAAGSWVVAPVMGVASISVVGSGRPPTLAPRRVRSGTASSRLLHHSLRVWLPLLLPRVLRLRSLVLHVTGRDISSRVASSLPSV